eukprot:7376791-Prymnesium_polylepis.1
MWAVSGCHVPGPRLRARQAAIEQSKCALGGSSAARSLRIDDGSARWRRRRAVAATRWVARAPRAGLTS